MPRRIRNPATMSVAIEVRSEVRVRSTSWRCCSGRSSGLASSTITGAKINTTTPSSNEVDSTSPAISRYAMKAPMNRGTISVSAPNSSVSPEATLSTSPVGVRSGSTWPSWAALRLTIFIGPYMPTSQVRTIRVWPAIPAAIPTRVIAARIATHWTTAAKSRAMMPSSMIRPTKYGPTEPGSHSSTAMNEDRISAGRCCRSSQRRKADGARRIGIAEGHLGSPIARPGLGLLLSRGGVRVEFRNRRREVQHDRPTLRRGPPPTPRVFAR